MAFILKLTSVMNVCCPAFARALRYKKTSKPAYNYLRKSRKRIKRIKHNKKTKLN